MILTFVLGLAAAIGLIVTLQTRGASRAPNPGPLRKEIDEALGLRHGTGTLDVCSVVVRFPEVDTDNLVHINVSAPIPSELQLEREGTFESNDWQTGDRDFDRALKLGANSASFGFALGATQRRQLTRFVAPNVQFSVDHGSMRIEIRDPLAGEVLHLTRTAVDLMTFWAMPVASSIVPIIDNAEHDPLPAIRAIAIETMAKLAPVAFERHLEVLRGDRDPQVQLAIALNTRQPQDIRGVPFASLVDADRRRLWDRCVDALDADSRCAFAKTLLELTASEVDADRYAR